MKGLTIRRFRMEDTDPVLALWKACGIETWERGNPRQTIQKKHSHSPEAFFLGSMGGEVVATVITGYDGLRGWVYRLAVKPELQRRGIGTAMMEKAEGWLRRQGCVKAKLQLEERAADAVGFYRKLGYETQPLVSMSKWFEPAGPA